MLVCESFKKKQGEAIFICSLNICSEHGKKINQTNLHRLNITTSVLANLV